MQNTPDIHLNVVLYTRLAGNGIVFVQTGLKCSRVKVVYYCSLPTLFSSEKKA